MLNRLSDLVRLRTFADSQVPPVSRVNMEALSDLMPGDTVRALVEATLADGTYRVAIRNQPFTLRLPFQARAGDTLQLSVAAREPQLRFALAAEDQIPELATNLSETARFITALLDESEKFPLTQTTRSGAPLLASEPGDSAETAAALRDAIAHSGMFYESHQAQWLAGERALSALLREPQARFAPLRNDHKSARARPAGDADQSAVVIVDGAPQLPELPVHRDALTMIKQQLDTLESRQVAWHGMIWQGQPLDWEVTEQPRDTPPGADAPPWRTQLRLTLPRMGKIDATLLVAAHGVTISLRAAAAETQTVLTTQRTHLQKSLRDAGVTPLGITVHAYEPA
jgi:hypothetical protein